MIALDGKTVRGARTRPDGKAPHLVAALDHATGTVLGQVAIDAKSNEIPAVRDLLACFDLTGAVVTVDAMHTQTDTATAITEAGGDYVFTVKGNTPTLHRAAEGPALEGRARALGDRDRPRPAGDPHHQGRGRARTGSTSPARRRSPRSAGPSPRPGRRASRSST